MKVRLMSIATVAATAATVFMGSWAIGGAAGQAPPVKHCGSACAERVRAKALERHYQRVWSSAPAAMRAHLRRIAQCESTNNHRAVSANGLYRGLLQFDFTTWGSVGGRGDPAAATRWEQWARGVRLYRSRGAQPWPVCKNR